MKVFMVVGEDSGDLLAAPLIRALREQHGDALECFGIGGPAMKAAGFKELLPMDQISVIGLWEVLPKIPRLMKIHTALIDEIEKDQPDVVVTVDFPDFNFLLAKKLKRRGVYKGKLIHYVAPSVWAWRAGRAKAVSEFLDGIMCLFPMEVSYFSQHNIKAVHVGHPLVASGAKNALGTEFRDANDIPQETKTVGLFFGSRESEFKNLSPIMKDATILVRDIEKKIRVISPTLPRLEFEVQKILHGIQVPVYVSCNPSMKWKAFKACDVAIACSGTVALELAYAGVPHIIVYKVNPITAFFLKLMVKVKYAHLANILLDRPAIPEFLQHKCVPELIAQAVLDLMQSEELRNQQKEVSAELEKYLSNDEGIRPSVKAAQFVTEIAHQKSD